MRVILQIFFISFLLSTVFGFAYFAFGSNFGITGLVVEDLEEEVRAYTEQEALNAIERAKDLVEEVEAEGLPVKRLNDLIIESEKIFEIAKNAEILRGDFVNEIDYLQRKEARESLKYIEWEDVYYVDVIESVEDIEELITQIYEVSDKISAISIREDIEVVDSEIGLSPDVEVGEDEKTQEIFSDALKAFEEERFEDVDKKLDEFDAHLEEVNSNSARLRSLGSNTGAFIKRNWVFVLVGLAVFYIAGAYSYSSIHARLLKNKVEKMKTEKKALKDLIKKAQTERFKDGKLSELVYKIRIKKYKQRDSEINRMLPVLEEKLRVKRSKTS